MNGPKRFTKFSSRSVRLLPVRKLKPASAGEWSSTVAAIGDVHLPVGETRVPSRSRLAVMNTDEPSEQLGLIGTQIENLPFDGRRLGGVPRGTIGLAGLPYGVQPIAP